MYQPVDSTSALAFDDFKVDGVLSHFQPITCRFFFLYKNGHFVPFPPELMCFITVQSYRLVYSSKYTFLRKIFELN